ncbi:MAG: DUF5317 domain-containing protein [Firmicutes bacterium]|nr:DUF5317 domain-containing protein [Bacillota bacterium]
MISAKVYEGVKVVVLDAALASVAIGKIRGGQIRRLGNLPLRRVDLIILAFLVEQVLIAAGLKGWPALSEIAPYLYIVTYILLFIAVWSNRSMPEMLVMGAGILLNFIVIAANGGRMPVSPEGLIRIGMGDQISLIESGRAVTYCLAGPGARLSFLGDMVAIGRPYPVHRMTSVGDIVIAVGVFLLIQRWMMRRA